MSATESPKESTLNPPAGSMELAKLRALIADDGFAATFQTMGRYRTALLQVAAALARSSIQDAEAVVTDHSVEVNKMVELSADDRNALALEHELVRLVAELPDRTSPENDPTTVLANAEELGACLHVAIENLGFRVISDTAQPRQQAGVIEDAVAMLKLVKRDLMHARRFGADTLRTYKNVCVRVEGDVEEWLNEHRAAARQKEGGHA